MYMYNVNMNIEFAWDQAKELINIRKHSISFDEASTIFMNSPLEIFFDPDHSADEDRYIAVGFSQKNRCLIVVHCENISGTQIRIISARRATKREQHKVFGGRVL